MLRPAVRKVLPDGCGGLHQSDDADHWRGTDRLAERFVVEADIAAGDRRLEEGACFGHAFDGFD